MILNNMYTRPCKQGTLVPCCNWAVSLCTWSWISLHEYAWRMEIPVVCKFRRPWPEFPGSLYMFFNIWWALFLLLEILPVLPSVFKYFWLLFEGLRHNYLVGTFGSVFWFRVEIVWTQTRTFFFVRSTATHGHGLFENKNQNTQMQI